MIKEVLSGRMVILLFVVLLTDSVSSSQVVKVGVYPGQGGADYQLYVGTLEILASRRDDSLQSLVTSSVGGVVMGYLRGTFYTGQVTGRQDCRARLWIEKEKLVSANIDCRRKHIVVEEEEAGRYVMQTKKQSATKAGCGETRCDENQQNVCTMYIQTDPFFWKYYRPRHEDDEQTRAAIVRKMVDHIMAANEMFSKYEFSKNSSLQFVLAGLKISRDGECEKYSAGEAMFHQADISISSQDLNGSLYQDYYGTYDDPPWYPEEEPDEVHLNANNCYEDIEGVANISVDFCKLFYPDQATLYLNMFSSLDHTNYCLAHIWTYRRLEVLGLADTPTLGSPGLSGFCATYDHDCSIGFNTGLISFQHQGQHLPLADSQETFIHELGHSFGASHDPDQDPSCAPGGRFGNFIMAPGPFGGPQLRREFSPCTRREISRVAEELFSKSCLLSPDQLEQSNTTPPGGSHFHTLNQNCDAGRILDLMENYIIDLTHYTADRRQKAHLTQALQSQFQNSMDIWKEQGKISLKSSLRAFFRDLNDSGMVSGLIF